MLPPKLKHFACICFLLLCLLAIETESIKIRKSRANESSLSGPSKRHSSKRAMGVVAAVFGATEFAVGVAGFGLGQMSSLDAAVVADKVNRIEMGIESLHKAITKDLGSKLKMVESTIQYSQSMQLCKTFISYTKKMNKPCEDEGPCFAKKLANIINLAGDGGADHALRNIHDMIVGKGSWGPEKSIFAQFADAYPQEKSDYVLKVLQNIERIMKLQNGCYQAWEMAMLVNNRSKGGDEWDPVTAYENRKCSQVASIERFVNSITPYYWKSTMGPLKEQDSNLMLYEKEFGSHVICRAGDDEKFGGYVVDHEECRYAYDPDALFDGDSMTNKMDILYNRCGQTGYKLTAKSNMHETGSRILVDTGRPLCWVPGSTGDFTHGIGTVVDNKCVCSYEDIRVRSGYRAHGTYKKPNEKGSENFSYFTLDCDIASLYKANHRTLPENEGKQCP